MAAKAPKDKNIDISNMSAMQLRQLQKKAAIGLARETAKRVEELRRDYARIAEELTSIGAEYGLTLSRVLSSSPHDVQAALVTFATNTADNPSSAVAQKRKVVAPKYRNPENPTQTWTGRGNRPLWVTSWLERHPNQRISALVASIVRPRN